MYANYSEWENILFVLLYCELGKKICIIVIETMSVFMGIKISLIFLMLNILILYLSVDCEVNYYPGMLLTGFMTFAVIKCLLRRVRDNVGNLCMYSDDNGVLIFTSLFIGLSLECIHKEMNNDAQRRRLR